MIHSVEAYFVLLTILFALAAWTACCLVFQAFAIEFQTLSVATFATNTLLNLLAGLLLLLNLLLPLVLSQGCCHYVFYLDLDEFVKSLVLLILLSS